MHALGVAFQGFEQGTIFPQNAGIRFYDIGIGTTLDKDIRCPSLCCEYMASAKNDYPKPISSQGFTSDGLSSSWNHLTCTDLQGEPCKGWILGYLTTFITAPKSSSRQQPIGDGLRNKYTLSWSFQAVTDASKLSLQAASQISQNGRFGERPLITWHAVFEIMRRQYVSLLLSYSPARLPQVIPQCRVEQLL